VPPRGVSLGELFDSLEARTDRDTIVLLDELELMSPKDRDREILYLLSRSRKRFMVIGLSNNPRVLRDLDPATRSSLQPVPLHFKNYDAEQIQLILQDRARQGLRQYDESLLAQIAALTVRRTNSDTRVAIKTLYYSVTQDHEALEECFERARRDVVVDMVADLSDTALMTLRAVAASGTEFARNVYARYRCFCQGQGEKPISYVYFSSNLSYLQSAGLVALISTKVGRSYPNRVQLTVDRSTLEHICRLRFQQQ
jgi:archaeal cell division control protein 6